MLRKSPADRQRAAGCVAPPNEVAEEPIDAVANGISGGFRRVANRAAVLAQVCRDASSASLASTFALSVSVGSLIVSWSSRALAW